VEGHWCPAEPWLGALCDPQVRVPSLGDEASLLDSRFVCRPEPHILLFRRALGTDPVTGKVNAAVAAQAKAAFEAEYSGAAERK